MNAIIAISGTKIHNENGLYSLNDLHKASGGLERHKPANWLRSKQTIELTKEIEKAQIRAIQSKQRLGTFVCKELVIHYGMWISPEFSLKVIRTFLYYDSFSQNGGKPKGERSNKDYYLISQEQAQQIQLAVEQRSQRTGESYQKIYVGLHAYLGIDSYKTMPVEHFTAAIKYLESMPDAPELFKVLDNDVTVSRVNLSALIHYMDWCYYWFQDIRKGLSHFNDNLVVPMIDKFSDGHLAAGLLAYPLGIEMLPIDEMRYFPWTKDGKIQDKYWEIHIQKNMIARSYI